MRIVFMGSPDFSVPTLEALIGSEHEIAAVYSQPPRPAGRGKALRTTPVHQCAEAAGIEVRTPLNFKKPEEIKEFQELEADLAVVIAYGMILPQEILDAPKHGCVNLHASLLPRWRGAAPIHRAIMAGDEETGVCLMQMEAGLDTGPVLACEKQAIKPEMTTGDLHQILASLSSKILIDNLNQLPSLKAEPQPENGVIYAEKITKEEALINWNLPAKSIRCHIHGLSPFPGAWSELEGERIKFHRVEVAKGEGASGQILDDQFRIACGEAALMPIEIQRAGKRAMPTSQALLGMGEIQSKIMGSK